MKHFCANLLAIGAVALLGLTAGCNKSSNGPTDSGSGAGGTAAGENAIVVGEFASLTGSEATFGNSSHEGTQLAIDELNSKGGVLGRKVALKTEDTQSKQQESAIVVRKLISREKAVAILGEVASSRSLEAAPICQSSKIPMISPSSTNPRVTEVGDYIFRVCFLDSFQGAILARFAKNTLKSKNCAVITDVSQAYAVGLAKYFIEPFTKDGGKIAAEQKFSGGDKDFKAQLTAIKAGNPDAIFVPGYYTEAALICRQARELGITVPIFGGDGWEAPELLQIGGSAMENTYYSTHFSPESSDPRALDFVKKYKAKYNNKIPDAMAALGYDSAMVLAEAIKQAGATDGSKVRDALAGIKDFEGVTGKTTIDPHRDASKAAVVIAVKNGKFVQIETIAP
jgi:branched-chain amino acid transport system substrate-binding protein